MMDKKRSSGWFLLMLFAAVITTCYAMSYIVAAPWHVMPQLGGDGGKNVYTFLYHILYDKGFWFSGMNYPFGEHIVYADGQSLLSVPLSYLKSTTISQAFTIMWYGILCSYLLSVVYCYLLLTRLKVAPLLSILFALLITFCAPQVIRISGHYALAYMCVIPMLIYWTLCYSQSQNKKYAVYFLLCGVAMSFMHPYYAAMILIFVCCYTAAYLLTQKQPLVDKFRHCLPLLLASLSVLIVLFGIMHLTDPYTDRPATPYGILAACTTGKEIFTSSYSPLWCFAKDKFQLKFISEGGEGYVYLGLVTIFVLLISIALKLISKKKVTGLPGSVTSIFPNTWILMAVFALLFSMGVPFVWGMQKLLDYMTVFKQFRSMGRFSWIFYYLVTIYASVQLNNWFQQKWVNNSKMVALVILLPALLVWGIEASGYMASIRQQAANGYKNYDVFFLNGQQTWEQFLQEHQHKKEDFQAIIALPFFEVGSEKIWLGGEDNATAFGFAMSIQAALPLHLPIMDGMMSRTSWTVAEDEVKIAGGPFTDKPALRQLKNHKPFLLLNMDTDPLEDPDQRYLFAASEYMGHFLHNEAYICYPDRILNNDNMIADSASKVLSMMRQEDTCTGDTSNWRVFHLDNLQAESSFWGSGAFGYVDKDNVTLATIPITGNVTGKQYEFSSWCLLPADNYKSPYFELVYLDAGGQKMGDHKIFTKECKDNLGLWFRAGEYVKLPEHCAKIVCLLRNDDHNYIAIDEILFRSAGGMVISKDKNGRTLVNNHIFRTINKQ